MHPLDRLLEPGRLFGGALVNRLLNEHLDLAEPEVGQTLGAFRIERELGRGGMGIIYLASRADGAYEQQVAIKWLPIGRLDAAQVDQFRRERQIHARLCHPNIARLLDGGHSEDGHLWFALEHIDGAPVDRYAARHGLSWRERVALLLPVIDAVQFAHGRLLVHRDIKPDNVLIDGEGRAKLIDFGVATLLDDDARHACTPDFASPEQLAGEPSAVASDVWQLGHLLRLVLAAGVIGEPAPNLSPDLHAIIAKATDRNPIRRYETAAALGLDLQRLLHHQPVFARPPRLLHRLQLLIQAHPLSSLGTMMMTLAFVVTVIGFEINLTQQRDAAEHARSDAEAVNNFLLQDFLPGADPLRAGSTDISVVELSKRALEKVEPRLHGLPMVAARIESSLGHTLANLGHFAAADQAFYRAASHYAEAYGPADERVLSALLSREEVAIDRNSIESAEKRLRVLRADASRNLGPNAVLLGEIDSQLARAAFLRDDFVLCESRYQTLLPRFHHAAPAALADAYAGLSVCESRLGRWDQALVHAQSAAKLDTRALGPDDPRTLETEVSIESALVGLGRYDDAVVLMQRLYRRLEQRYGALHPTTLTVAHDLGLALTCASQAPQGEQWLWRAASGRAQMLGTQHPWYAMTEIVLAMALIQQHKLVDAGRALQQARDTLGQHARDNPFIQATYLENVADLALARGHDADAIVRFHDAIAAAVQVYPAQHRRMSVLRLGLGLALVHHGDKRIGKPVLRDALLTLGDHATCRPQQVLQARAALPD